MIPPEFLKTIAAAHAVSELEMDVLVYALGGEQMVTIAQRLDLTPEAVRKRLGEVYKKFHISGAGPGKLAKLQHLLMAQYQEQQTQVGVILPKERWDIQEAPEPIAFYGRTAELTALWQWLVDDRCRLVGIWGAKGIGKTALTVKLAKNLQAGSTEQHGFTVGIWRSLLYVTSLSQVLDDLLQALDPQASLPDTGNDKLGLFLQYLSEQRCVIILDAIDELYSHDRQAVDQLFARLANEVSHSCLVVSTLERNKSISVAANANQHVRLFQLQGLDPAAATDMLNAEGLTAKPTPQQKFLEQCQYNPLALKKYINVIRDLFRGSIDDFIGFHSSFVENSLSAVTAIADDYSKQITQLGQSLERMILDCLLEHPKGLSLNELKKILRTTVDLSSSDLLRAIDTLERKLLLEQRSSSSKASQSSEVRVVLPSAVASHMKQYHHPPSES